MTSPPRSSLKTPREARGEWIRWRSKHTRAHTRPLARSLALSLSHIDTHTLAHSLPAEDDLDGLPLRPSCLALRSSCTEIKVSDFTASFTSFTLFYNDNTNKKKCFIYNVLFTTVRCCCRVSTLTFSISPHELRFFFFYHNGKTVFVYASCLFSSDKSVVK